MMLLVYIEDFPKSFPILSFHLHNIELWRRLTMTEDNIFCVLLSICLFLLFRRISIGSIWWINSFSATMLGVYLIHDNNLIRHWLWKDFLDVPSLIQQPMFVAHSLVCIFGVFISCIAIEEIRLKMMNPWLTRLTSRLKKFDMVIVEKIHQMDMQLTRIKKTGRDLV